MKFLDTLSHPNHIQLAKDIFAGVDSKTLYATYGRTRVLEMKAKIINYNKSPKKKLIKQVGCLTCRVN